ncbi:uncharacterized protein LOC119112300 [Pollicipes pollicipes]|uniref:uncharacterized protein LOC119112300 n=1 Tax=Pollicipes pollicipes TaxID=41117 RepID=UPI0018849055|nr:uncharacterized protein LOC119112300 [Pollicipes pollicipes]
MNGFIVFSALLALAAAQDGYSYGAPETGYDYKEPVNPQGSGNTPGGSVIKPAGDEDHHHGGSSDPLQWLRDSVPGEPGVDYPIYATIPPTSFSCDGRVPGYYADVEAGCQPFHVCNTMVGDESMKLSFLCPNGTIFNQEGFACQWWSDVDCASAEQFYNKNEEIGKVPESAASNNVNSVVGGPSQPQNSYQQPQNSYQQPPSAPRPQAPRPQAPRPQTPRPQTPRPQAARPRPQAARPRPQAARPRPQAPRPRPQAPRPRPQAVRPVPNQYIPPTTTTTTTTVRPPPGLYNLPRN